MCFFDQGNISCFGCHTSYDLKYEGGVISDSADEKGLLNKNNQYLLSTTHSFAWEYDLSDGTVSDVQLAVRGRRAEHSRERGGHVERGLMRRQREDNVVQVRAGNMMSKRTIDPGQEGVYFGIVPISSVRSHTFRYFRGTFDESPRFFRDCPIVDTPLGWVYSDWAGDTDTRRSHAAYIIMINGVPISRKSRRQDSVTLSTSEAE
jgi:hypothetical protein